MMRHADLSRRSGWSQRKVAFAAYHRGFTLIELLVVVSIIALLISILLPSLKKARDQAKAVKCAANLCAVGKAVSTYTAESRGYFPTAYLYASDYDGSYDIRSQPPDASQHGYIHWSWFLFSAGRVSDDAFRCPSMRNGGLPRTNPGPEKENWEPDQVDDNGTGWNKDAIEDKQATRVAFTVNAAIMPRNKFSSSDWPNADRLNQYVSDAWIKKPAGTILATEFLNNWEKMSINASGGKKVKSHRPISPFANSNGVYFPYSTPESLTFWYGGRTDPGFDLVPKRDLGNAALFDSPTYQRANFVGRHHPGGDDVYGGTANFVYVDGHIDRKTAYQSLKLREWGDRYWSVTGKSDVVLHAPIYRQTARGPWP